MDSPWKHQDFVKILSKSFHTSVPIDVLPEALSRLSVLRIDGSGNSS
jgi:hypothetical protein